jgi:hypothetical protein
MMKRSYGAFAWLLAAGGLLGVPAQAAVSPEEAAQLKTVLTPLGAERAGSEDGRIPAWEGGLQFERPPLDQMRNPDTYAELSDDTPLFTITAANLAQYRDQLTVGQLALFQKYPETYKMVVYPTQRTASAPDFVYEATFRNATTARLENDGESLVDAAIGIPFPIPKSGKELIWNHKLRYRGEGVRRYNTQLAVQTNGSYQPYKLREDVRFHYNDRNATPENIDNVIIYFLQFTTAPARQSGNVLLVHETMDQVAEARRAWLYNPGLRRIRRAPNVAYDNPGTGADGLRTNDQLDQFNGATDRYTWNIVGKREMFMPYNGVKLVDSALGYGDIAKRGHMNQDLARYELRRVWVLDSHLKAGTAHQYKRRTFYIDEDSWSILAVDVYDSRDQLWRVQEGHLITVPWMRSVAFAASTVYDLQANRYLLLDLSNEEPVYEEHDWPLEHFTTGSVQRMAIK